MLLWPRWVSVKCVPTNLKDNVSAPPHVGCVAGTDKDGNGTVDFDEFYTWYNGSSRAMGKAEVKVLAYFQRSADT